MKLTFREATGKDFEAVAKLVKSEAELRLISPKSTFPWTLEQVKAIAESRQFNTIAFAETGEIVGYANLYNILPNHIAFIGNVIVAKNYRNKQIGQQLMQHMLAVCQNHLNATAQLSVFNHNTDALRFYHQLGFIPFAMEQRDYHAKKMMLIHLRLPKT